MMSGSKENRWSGSLGPERNGGALDQNDTAEEYTTTLLLLRQDFWSTTESS